MGEGINNDFSFRDKTSDREWRTECHATVTPPYPSDTSNKREQVSNSYYEDTVGEGINNGFSFRDGVTECHATVTPPYPSDTCGKRGQVATFTMTTPGRS